MGMRTITFICHDAHHRIFFVEGRASLKWSKDGEPRADIVKAWAAALDIYPEDAFSRGDLVGAAIQHPSTGVLTWIEDTA